MLTIEDIINAFSCELKNVPGVSNVCVGTHFNKIEIDIEGTGMLLTNLFDTVMHTRSVCSADKYRILVLITHIPSLGMNTYDELQIQPTLTAYDMIEE